MIEIFYAGTHRDRRGAERTFSEAQIQEIATTYDRTRHEAPFLIGHDESLPNQGLVKAVIALGGKLFAIPHKVVTEFSEAVNAGRYPKVSCALYSPDDPANPVAGKWGLRHVAAVQVPAVKGMESPSFAEEPECGICFAEGIEFSGMGESYTVMLFRNLREWFIADGKQELADQLLAEYALSGLQAEAIAEQIEDEEEGEEDAPKYPNYSEQNMPKEDKANQELIAENIRLKGQLDQRDNAEFCEALIKDGKLQPALKSRAVMLLGSMPSNKIEFGEGDDKKEQPIKEALKDFLKALPVAIAYNEVSPDAINLPQDPAEMAKLITAKHREENLKGNEISFSEAQALVEAGK